ncbi:MAG: hypothetical protein DCC75_12725 [Proteobacteria bacterium]|nr:MAG: hypothetical protein DCC75_12725 [Pseudomonadota bacterium]
MEGGSERLKTLDILRLLLIPLVRFCLRKACSAQDFMHVTKLAFIQVAEEEITRTGKKVNVSRVSVVTGLHRGDLKKLYGQKLSPTQDPVSLVARVVGQWRYDKRFCHSPGKPRLLSFKGENSEFRALCAAVSTNLNAGTILFELERLGLAERTPRGLKHLVFIPSSQHDPVKAYGAAAEELDVYLQAIRENLEGNPDISNLHLFTSYDNILVCKIPEIRRWFVEKGKLLHREAREFLSKFDKDINPGEEADKEAGGGKVALGTFSFTVLPPSHAHPEKHT